MATLELVYKGTVGGDAVCPPEDVYTLVLQEYGEVEARPIFEDRMKPLDEAKMQNQIKMTFRITGTSDDDDEELAGWIGETVSDWFTLPANPLHEKAKFGKLARAVLKQKEFAVGEVIELSDLVEQPFKATITAKESGWPKIDGFMSARTSRKGTPLLDEIKKTKKTGPVMIDDVNEDDSWPEE